MFRPRRSAQLRWLPRRARTPAAALEDENRRLARDARREPLPGVVCISESMRSICRLVERAAASDISVLFVGETGTGKKVLLWSYYRMLWILRSAS